MTSVWTFEGFIESFIEDKHESSSLKTVLSENKCTTLNSIKGLSDDDIETVSRGGGLAIGTKAALKSARNDLLKENLAHYNG